MHIFHRGLCAIGLAASLAGPVQADTPADTPPDCSGPASSACYFAFTPPGSGGQLHFYASRAPGVGAPTSALVAVHGHGRDANKSFDAALAAVQRGGALHRSLVVAPVFQVGAADAGPCRTPGVPAAQDGDLLWTCASWLAGGRSHNASGLGAYAALDALVAELQRQWPSLRSITIAGFSAGAQMVQRAIGFAAVPPAPLRLRYVVASPGSWLYLEPVWPAASVAACPALLRWKYGPADLPAHLGRSAEQARAHYAQADIHLLAGALDSRDGPGTFARILDHSCAAQAQGPYRLQRAQAYAAHDPRHPLAVVPGCAHDVACVFAAPEARAALLGAVEP